MMDYVDVDQSVKVGRLVIYNALNSTISQIYKKELKTFKDYQYKLKKYHQNATKLFKRGSIKYYHDTRVVDLVDPFLLSKTGEDFIFWVNEVHESIMELVEILVQYNNEIDYENHTAGYEPVRSHLKREVKNGRVSVNSNTLSRHDRYTRMRKAHISDDYEVTSSLNLTTLKRDLDIYYDNMKSLYEIDKNFNAQGPKITCDDTHNPYRLNEWYKALEFAVNNFTEIDHYLEVVIYTIETLDKYIQRMNIDINGHKSRHKDYRYDDFMDEELNEADFFATQQKIHKALNNNIKRMMKYMVIRFGNYKKQLEYTLLDLAEVS